MIALLGIAPSEAATGITAPVANAANAIIQTGVIGALLILAIAMAIYAVWKLNKAQEARVKDQKEAFATVTALNSDLKDTLREVITAVEALRGTVQGNTEVLKANTAASAAMERTISETIRDAVRAAGYRRSSTPMGTPVVPPTG